jgi:hypothetical protein
MCICSALLTATGGYRAVVAFLLGASIPGNVVSALAGVFQLVWNDLSYLIAKPLRSAVLYDVLPFLGAGLNILAGSLLFLRSRIGTHATILNIIIGIIAAVVAIVTLMSRGRDDSWRIVSISSYLACNLAWLAYFGASLRRAIRGESANFR